MRVRIEATGEPGGTRLLTDDGRDLSDCVTAVAWWHKAGEIPKAELTMDLIPLTGVCDAKLVAPNGKVVKKIEYEDGTVDEF